MLLPSLLIDTEKAITVSRQRGDLHGFGIPIHGTLRRGERMKRVLEILSKPAALASGWTSAILCFSAAIGYWLAGEHRRAVCWAVLGGIEVAAIVL